MCSIPNPWDGRKDQLTLIVYMLEDQNENNLIQECDVLTYKSCIDIFTFGLEYALPFSYLIIQMSPTMDV